jgi:hypothetical protein
LCLFAWQQLADVLDAVLWERARELGRGQRAVDWKAVASQIVDELKTKWPERLSSRTAAKRVAVSLTKDALTKRFERHARDKVNPSSSAPTSHSK